MSLDDEEDDVPTVYCDEDIPRIGKYRVVDYLGTGGFSSCFKVVEQRWSRGRKRKPLRVQPPNAEKLCVKVFRAAEPTGGTRAAKRKAFAANKEIHIKAQREFSILQDLQSCGQVVEAYEVSQLTDKSTGLTHTFMTMQCCAMDLEDFTKVGTQFLARFADIGRWVLSGLGAMHELGLVHTDLKPENLLVQLAPDGKLENVVLTDVGSAHVIGQEVADSGRTLCFSAPEVLCDCDELVDGRSDVFSFGCLLFTLLFEADLFPVENEECCRFLGLVSRYSSNPFPVEVSQNLTYFYHTGVLREGAMLEAAYQVHWADIYSRFAPLVYVDMIQECTDADVRHRPSVDALLARFASAPPIDFIDDQSQDNQDNQDNQDEKNEKNQESPKGCVQAAPGAGGGGGGGGTAQGKMVQVVGRAVPGKTHQTLAFIECLQEDSVMSRDNLSNMIMGDLPVHRQTSAAGGGGTAEKINTGNDQNTGSDQNTGNEVDTCPEVDTFEIE